MQKITLTTETRRCINPNTFLGYEGENNANKLIFEFTDGFIDGLAVLKVERGETKGTIDLVKVEETYELEVKSSLLAVQGDIKFQFVITEPDGTITKYDPFIMTVKDALDADGELPEEYPSWQEIIATELAKVEKATENANKVAEELLLAKENGEFNGKDGEDGIGKDGISPEVTTEQTANGTKITITDAKGTQTVEVLNGKDGEDGKDGTMSFEDLTEEQKANLKGDKGDKGDDGLSPVANVTQTSTGAIITVTDKNGTTTATVYNGKDGQDGKDGVGKDGEKGKDGLTPYIGDNGNWWIGEEDTGVKASGDGSVSCNGVGYSNPIGTIIPFMGTETPEDYLVCDGAILKIADYRELANHFEKQFGSTNHFGGDGTTTFAVPDLRNEFLRGYHCNGEEQISGEIGIHQNGTAHARLLLNGQKDYLIFYGEEIINPVDGDKAVSSSTTGHRITSETYTASATSTIAYTARPTNVAVLFCIKYTESGNGGSSAVTASMPVGQVITHYGTKAPDGYLVCDGSIYNIADYPNLANHFLEDFGAINHCGGDGITTFAVPDLSNDFPRFYHNNKEEQLSGEIGEHQDATSQQRMFVSVGGSSGKVAWYTDTALDVSNVDTSTNASKGYQVTTTSYTPSGTAMSAYTARPRNTTFLACIKY